ncbi:PAS domain-containing protein [Sulfurovum riftiae]|uniref:PAS fold-3 domain-containing protein n=1 Tax=Sulfurovum riftiae TaxID=1630136 RepID=A0A151CGZ4_9BACT|nr:PAS domain-containing protein [Sulfurovum riftiae]KYJ86533.1 hypothetical protein AS592_06945 [Sulfurovum riftiae]
MENLRKIIHNRRTGEQVVPSEPTDNEIEVFEESVLISEIDKYGFITYANRRYVELSGFPKKTLIGAHYTIDRHPDMPEGLFHARDEIVARKKVWRGYVKNLCRDGSFYWTLTYMQPKLDSESDIVGYTLTRKKAYAAAIEEIEKKYAALQGKAHIGHDFFMRGELYHGEELATNK